MKLKQNKLKIRRNKENAENSTIRIRKLLENSPIEYVYMKCGRDAVIRHGRRCLNSSSFFFFVKIHFQLGKEGPT